VPFPDSVAVTGGAGDIGAAIGAELAEGGARVLLIDVKPREEAEPWLARVPGADYVRADVRDRDALRRALALLDPLDAAIGNAGIVRSAPFLDVTEEQWREQLDVNLTGVFNLAQLAARLMVERGTRGRIVLTGSWVGAVPWPEISAYSASKAGVAMLARSMARELAPHGILVNVVAPGIVDAGLARRQRETEPQYAARVAKVIPLGRLQQAEDVARVVAFLLSPGGDYVTGSTLLADGGCSLFQFD
jgi:NAD(P)-dependent dehydrogenase (short-subunit alcohol dehydrogenase family)